MPAALDDRVRTALLHHWHPLGLRHDVLGAERYACQVQDVTLLLLGGADDDALADYLRAAEALRLGLGAADEERVRRAVAALRTLRDGPEAGTG
jgi:hypothetical protein